MDYVSILDSLWNNSSTASSNFENQISMLIIVGLKQNRFLI